MIKHLIQLTLFLPCTLLFCAQNVNVVDKVGSWNVELVFEQQLDDVDIDDIDIALQHPNLFNSTLSPEEKALFFDNSISHQQQSYGFIRAPPRWYI